MVTQHRRRALVTGGSSGIGRAIAESLALDGCDVGIFYLGEPDEGRPVVKAIESHGGRGWMHIGDVSDSGQAQAAVDSFIAEFGGIDILINNAGIFRDHVIWKMSDEEWRSVIDVDLTGVFNFSRAVAPTMRNNGGGAIVNISSINGLRGKFGQSNYSAAKAGVMALTRCSALEVAEHGVRINAVSPSFATHPFLVKTTPKETLDQLEAQEAFGRGAQPFEVANVMVFLASDYSSYMTGETVAVSSQRA